jgi:hypothetical protein
MNEKIFNHVANYNKSKGWEETQESVIETIMEAKQVYSETTDSRRHWDEEFVVVEIDGMLIGFEGASTTGDETAEDKGWSFDPETICEVVAKEVTKTIYVAV